MPESHEQLERDHGNDPEEEQAEKDDAVVNDTERAIAEAEAKAHQGG